MCQTSGLTAQVLFLGVPVTSLVADGETEVLLEILAESDATASVSLNSLGAFNASQLVTLNPQTIDSWEAIGPASYRATLSFKAHEIASWPDRNFPLVEIYVQQGEALAQALLTIEARPVLALHGVWSDSSAWLSLERLRQSIPLSSLLRAEYPNHFSFAGPEVQRAVRAQIDRERAKLLNQGSAVTRFDVVGHSMGGLVARSMPTQPGYRRQANRGFGDLHRLIAVGSPMLGSPLATNLLENRFNPPGPTAPIVKLLLKHFEISGPVSLGALLDQLNMKINCSPHERCAMHSLQPGSDELSNQLGSALDLPYAGIRGIAPASSNVELALNALLKSFAIVPSSLDELFLSAGDSIHDTIVGLTSQTAEAAPQFAVVDVVHASTPLNDVLVGRTFAGNSLGVETETTSAEVVNLIACYLGGIMACDALLEQAESPAVADEALGTQEEFLDLDLSGRSEVSENELVVSAPENVLAGTLATISIGAVDGLLESVYYIFDDAPLRKATGDTAELSSVAFGSVVKFTGLVLLSDERFALVHRELGVILPDDAPITLSAAPASLIAFAELGTQLRVWARYPTVVVDVTQEAAFEWFGPGSLQVVNGNVTGQSAGHGVLQIHWRGKSTDVDVLVVDEQTIFVNGFEQQ